jgi:pyruvate dehydrogenase (quinone)
VTADSGSSTVWYARYLKLRRGMLASGSGMLATMGSAIPYALAAKLAYPERPVVATTGDGAMQMIGLNALLTSGNDGGNGRRVIRSGGASRPVRRRGRRP